MAEIQIHHISLTCRDPLAVERFYTRHFGFVRGRVVRSRPEATRSSSCADPVFAWSCSRRPRTGR